MYFSRHAFVCFILSLWKYTSFNHLFETDSLYIHVAWGAFNENELKNKDFSRVWFVFKISGSDKWSCYSSNTYNSDSSDFLLVPSGSHLKVSPRKTNRLFWYLWSTNRSFFPSAVRLRHLDTMFFFCSTQGQGGNMQTLKCLLVMFWILNALSFFYCYLQLLLIEYCIILIYYQT